MNFWDTFFHVLIGIFDIHNHRMVKYTYKSVTWHYCTCGYNKPKKVRQKIGKNS